MGLHEVGFKGVFFVRKITSWILLPAERQAECGSVSWRLLLLFLCFYDSCDSNAKHATVHLQHDPQGERLQRRGC